MRCRSEGALAPRSSSAHSTVTISTSCSQARHQATIECPRTLITRCVSVCDTVRLRTRTYHLDENPGRPALSARFGRFTGPCQPKSSRASRRHETQIPKRPEPLLCSRKEQVATILREGGERSFASVLASAAEFTPSPKLNGSGPAEYTGVAANWSDNRPSPACRAMIVCFVRNVFIALSASYDRGR